jgi:hypothetical protein
VRVGLPVISPNYVLARELRSDKCKRNKLAQENNSLSEMRPHERTFSSRSFALSIDRSPIILTACRTTLLPAENHPYVLWFVDA